MTTAVAARGIVDPATTRIERHVLALGACPMFEVEQWKENGEVAVYLPQLDLLTTARGESHAYRRLGALVEDLSQELEDLAIADEATPEELAQLDFIHARFGAFLVFREREIRLQRDRDRASSKLQRPKPKARLRLGLIPDRVRAPESLTSGSMWGAAPDSSRLPACALA